ncbi:MAG TPA: RING finger protein, partial [Planctomycetota bacterium]|nr:RING finger protein [Planctomycetota bacterium]
LALQLLDALPGVTGRERIRVGPARQRIDADSVCRICGTALAQGKVVRCAKCATPHHADCWAFNGRCAIFACGEVKSK